jgi:hypothetical protein
MLLARAVEVRACLASEVEEVLEAGVRDERRASAAALEERIRGGGSAVREAIEPGRADRRGAVETLAVRTSPSATSTASVNVPPTSIPSTRTGALSTSSRDGERSRVCASWTASSASG